MKMRIVSLLLVLLMLIVLLTGCTQGSGKSQENPFSERFDRYVVDYLYGHTVVVDRETGVCYLRTGSGSSATPVLNADGTLFIYGGDDQ